MGLTAIVLAVGCGSGAGAAPDAFVAPDAAPTCDAATYAATLIGAHYRNVAAGNPSANRSSCEYYRAEIEILGVDASACTLSGTFGWTGTGTDGVTTAGGASFTCSLADSATDGVYCTAGNLGTASTSIVGLVFSDSATDAARLTMTAGDTSCTSDLETVP